MLAMGRVGLGVLPLQRCDDPKEIADRQLTRPAAGAQREPEPRRGPGSGLINE